MKYPIGIQDFQRIREAGYVYVDKTALVYKLASEGSIYFLARPRRFGKSLLLSTLEYYFLGRKDLFEGLAIESMEKDWKEYPVFHLDFNASNFERVGALEDALDKFISKGEKAFGVERSCLELGLRFSDVLEAAHNRTGRRAVVLIDEYDKPLLDVMDKDIVVVESSGQNNTLEEHNRAILKGFYSVFKQADKHLQFVFLTGVTKFSQVSVFSGFNQLRDISLDARYETLCGISEEEMLRMFEKPVADLALKYGVSVNEMLDMLRRKFDGYYFSERLTGVYNPFSILNTFDSQKIDNYWFSTGTPAYLMRLMADNDVVVNELAGKYYSPSEFIDYKATKQMPLPMLYQSGYLTVKKYDMEFNSYLLDFPNDEVRMGILSLISASYFSCETDSESWVQEVTKCLRYGDMESFKLRLTSFLSGISYRFQRKQDGRECERYFQYTFYLIMQMLSTYSTYVEKETSQGRIDCVLECPDFVYIFEFKLNSTARAALRQIDSRGYALPYAADARTVYKVGISFSSETGTIKEVSYKAVKKNFRKQND